MNQMVPVGEPPELKKFSGHQRAAALMLALGKEHGAPIWDQLSTGASVTRRETEPVLAVGAGVVEEVPLPPPQAKAGRSRPHRASRRIVDRMGTPWLMGYWPRK